MTAAAPPAPRPPRSGRRPRSLRAQLLLAVLALLVAVFAVVGLVTQAMIRDYLTHRLDQQLGAASERSQLGLGDRSGPAGGRPPLGADGGSAAGGANVGGGTPPECLDVTGQGAGTLCAVVSGSTVSGSGVLVSDGGFDAVPAAAQQTLAAVPPDGRPRTVELAGLGAYRVSSALDPAGRTVVTGLPLRDVDDTVTRLAVVGGGVAGLAIVLGLAGGAALIGLTLRPLRRVAATAARVAELPLDRGEVALAERVPDDDPRTEVGAVGAAMNRMLDNIEEALSARQASETRVRQFVADASHELRTPLAAIRGYAELTRRSAEAVPPDVAHALRRVESEARRMTVLVEDLLLLARLDSGRPLDTAEVDLSALVVDALSDAYATAPDHRWELDLPAEPVRVSGDQPRLHQVVANLLANARTHTPPGTAVTVGLATGGGEVVLTVSDDGPGIPAALQPTLFERFVRGEQSRSRAAGSTGLGLAIVRAVVGAHGGSVSVASAPGRTTFSVRLPAGDDPPTLTAAAQTTDTVASSG